MSTDVLVTYATSSDRVRCSSLATLARCPGLHMDQHDEVPGGFKPAADTGSAVGRMIQLYHEGSTPGDAIAQAGRECSEKFPAADLEGAATRALRYMRDERNPPKIASHCELEVDLVLPGWEGEPDVHLRGHLDQIREGQDGRLYVWDVKDGAPQGQDLVLGYAWQLSAYALGATAKLGRPVLPGGIIRTKGYDVARAAADPSVCSVFFSAPWSLDQARAMLDNVVFMVHLIRKGLVVRTPGSHCSWCKLSPSTCSQ